MKKANLLLRFSLVAAAALSVAACGSDRDRVARNTNTDRTSQNTATDNTADRTAGYADRATGDVKDRDFYTKAAQGGMAEVEIARLAEQKASNPRVKQYASMLISDHTKANDELKRIAGTQNVTLPTEVDRSARSEMDKLNGLSGADFDREFINHAIDDHKDDIDHFAKEAKDGDNSELKNFAAVQLPHLRHHLEMAQNINDHQKQHADRRSR